MPALVIRPLAAFARSCGIASILLLASADGAMGADTFTDETSVPAPGDYRMVELYLEGSGLKSWNLTGPEVIRAAFRDGKARKVQRNNYAKYAAELTVTATAISGPVRWAPDATRSEFEITIAGVIADGVITGTWELTGKKESQIKGATPWSGPTKGSLRGTLTSEAALAKANALPVGTGWPCYYGPSDGGFSAARTGVALVSDPAQIRFAWRSEEFTAGGQGNANGYVNQIDGSHTQGGGATPVVSADGKLYVNYFRPAGSEYSAAGKTAMGTPDLKDTGGHLRQYWAYLNRHGLQPDPDTLLKYLAKADDIVVCMDAATGKTLWKTVYGGRGRFVHAHKIGPVNHTPCLGAGRVYTMGCGGTLYATDAVSGKPVWMVEGVGQLQEGQLMDRFAGNAPVFMDGVVVVGDQASTLHGFDAATGKPLWKLPGKNNSLNVPARWVNGGKSYIITENGDARQVSTHIFCVDPASGKVLWEAPYQAGIDGVSVCGDILVGVDGLVKNGYSKNYRVVAYRLTPTKAEPLWTLPCPDFRWFPLLPPAMNDEIVIVPMTAEKRSVLKMLATKTGKELAELVVTGDLASWNEPAITLVEDRVILVPDNSHGGQTIGVIGAKPETFKTMFTWWPPHPTTSSYHCKPMLLPWVDGRVFIRGLDGIYSYDFRAK